ncbi:hypothetical protein [Streptomyces sp. NPDC058614]|uniref:hypothetical protein n=1 Tax=Streptomyces sp. NPDC058614 TaxID=3346557 RepID=UPI003654BE8C
MSLPVIAIVIAVASASFTLGNWLTSLATFRRGGPRLKVKVRLWPHDILAAYNSGDTTKWRTSWHVHIANTGAAAMEVEKVEVTPWTPPRPLTLFFFPGPLALHRLLRLTLFFLPETTAVHRFLAEIRAMSVPTNVVWLEGEEKKRIEPYGGTRWIVNDVLQDSAETSLILWTPGSFGMLALRVTLTNGREVTSRPVFLHVVLHKHNVIHRSLSRLAEEQRQKAEKESGQLSFDDLQEEQS